MTVMDYNGITYVVMPRAVWEGIVGCDGKVETTGDPLSSDEAREIRKALRRKRGARSMTQYWERLHSSGDERGGMR